MGRGAERTITCMSAGCGYTYTHKRMDSKGWRRERMLHVTTGECARRIQETNDRELAVHLQGGGVTAADVTEALVPIYALIEKQFAEVHDQIQELKERVERRLESRRKKKGGSLERDALPAPWVLHEAVKNLKEFPDTHVVDTFKEIMTKDYENGWSWERAVGCWLHWMFDQCSADPVLLLRHDEVRFHGSAGKHKVTKLQFFRCFSKVCKNYDTLDEGFESFFIGFWYPMVQACRGMTHFENRIIFDLPCTEREKREFEVKVFPDNPYEKEPDLQFDRRIAQVFYDVMQARKAQRHADDQDDEKSSPK